MPGRPIRRIHFDDRASTLRAAAELGRLLAPGDCLELTGELGAGKTTFTKGVCSGRGIPEQTVTSPSFTLVNLYADEGGVVIAHVDGFRLRGDLEAETLGLEEVADSIFVVEWPDRLSSMLPQDRLRIRLLTGCEPEPGSEEERVLEVEAVGRRGSELTDAWLASLVDCAGARAIEEVAKGGPDGQEDR